MILVSLSSKHLQENKETKKLLCVKKLQGSAVGPKFDVIKVVSL